jgi:hypothetical protein
MSGDGQRVTVISDTTPGGGGNEHGRGPQRRGEREDVTAGAGTLARRSAQHDLSVFEREVFQQRAGVGHEAPRSSAPIRARRSSTSSKGRGSIGVEDRPPRTCNAKDARTVPPGAVRAVRDVGSGKAELATFVVMKGKPVISLAE